MERPDFTYEWYESLLTRLLDGDRNFRSFGGPLTEGTVLLRHDVDFSPRKAVEMARIEADRGIESTYFFLVSSPSYNPHNADIRQSIRTIDAMGHDVGLHFDASVYWDEEPPITDLRRRIRRERQALGCIVDDVVDIVAFHNPDEWMLGRRFPGFSHTYEPRYFEEMEYYADSNQRWRSQEPFRSSMPDSMHLLAHPILWGETDRTKNEHLDDERERWFGKLERHISAAMIEE